MLINTLSTGDSVYRYNKSVIVQFKGKRGVLSTGILNGGYSENLNSIINHDAKASAGMGCPLKAPTYKEHMEIIARELGLDPKTTSAIGTAADMENLSIKTESYKGVSVTALVTGGIENNGGRVGDPASFHEINGKIEQFKPGTINMLIMIDAKLPKRILTRALVTATEAKTAAIQELMAGSNYSHGIATGSGTDGTIIVTNLESDKELTNSGKHAKLGELIGKAVKEAVKEALYLQTGLSPEYQHSVFKRVKRYGITEETVWSRFEEIFDDKNVEHSSNSENKKCTVDKNKNNNEIDIKKVKEIKKINKLDYINNIYSIEKEEKLVTLTSLYVHLLDQLDWDLLSPNIVYKIGNEILCKISEELKIKNEIKKLTKLDKQNVVDSMIYNFNNLLAHKVIDFNIKYYI